VLLAGLLSALAMLTACATRPASTQTGLEGTAWQLVAIQSMDAAQGTTRMDNPQQFTLRFGADEK
jgi:hypothetical protein